MAKTHDFPQNQNKTVGQDRTRDETYHTVVESPKLGRLQNHNQLFVLCFHLLIGHVS